MQLIDHNGNGFQTPTHSLMRLHYLLPGAYEPPEGRKERPTLHYSMERHLNLNGRDTSLIWTYSQVGRKCCFQREGGREDFKKNVNDSLSTCDSLYSCIGTVDVVAMSERLCS